MSLNTRHLLSLGSPKVVVQLLGLPENQVYLAPIYKRASWKKLWWSPHSPDLSALALTRASSSFATWVLLASWTPFAADLGSSQLSLGPSQALFPVDLLSVSHSLLSSLPPTSGGNTDLVVRGPAGEVRSWAPTLTACSLLPACPNPCCLALTAAAVPHAKVLQQPPADA